MKVCSKCGILKENEEFSKNRTKKSGLSSECKVCHRAIRKIYYSKNSEVEKERVKSVKFSHRDWKENLKSGMACKLCGENHPAVLQFHHRDPKEKDFEISEAVHRGFNKSKILLEISKCVVLCSNCHFKEHYSLRLFGKSLIADIV